jgi:hypothetical protein
MRPTRTAFALSCALGAAILGALLGVAAPAAAEPVPATCPHLTVEGGEVDFLSAPPGEFQYPLPDRPWDCVLTAPISGGTQWQSDLYDSDYSEFLALVDAAFADSTLSFESGGTVDDDFFHLPDDAVEWPDRDATSPPRQANVSFTRDGSNGHEWYRILWERADAGSSSSSPFGEGEDAPWVSREFERSLVWVWLEVFDFSEEPAAPVSTTHGFDDPSSMSQLKTVLDAVPTPFQAIVLTFTGALLTIFIGLPSALVSGVLSARWDRWFGWARRPSDAVRRVTDRAQRPWVFWVGIVVASLIAAFVDPKFGLNWMSFRLYLTLFAAFAVFNVGAWLVIARVLRRLEPELPKPELRLRIGSLFVLLLGVLVSRLLVLEPGIVFGIVAGLVFATTLVASRRAGVVLVGAGFAAAAGIAAWILYSVLTLALGGVESAFTVGVIEFFGGLTLQGLSALPIALLPFAVLDGGALFRWNRPLWVAVYLGATVLFLLVIVNVPNGVTAVPGDFLRWLGLYFAFAVVATAIWGIDRLLEMRREAPRLPESEAAR